MESIADKKIVSEIRHKNRLPLGKAAIVNIVLAFAFLFFLSPIIWTLLISFKSHQQIVSKPPSIVSSFTLENYATLFNIRQKNSPDQDSAFSKSKTVLEGKKSASFVKSILSTALVSICSVLISLLVGIPAAYGLSRYRTKGKESLAFLFLSFRFVPEFMIIIPLYLIYQRIGLYGTYFGLIWVYILISLPMIIWIVRSFFDDLPFDLEQAAMLDGYSRMRAFLKYVLPLAKPGIAAATILSFIYAWNNFIFAFILSKAQTAPITVTILGYYDIKHLNYGNIAAAIMIAILPMIVVSQIGSKYLVGGLSFGAIKK